MSALTHTPLSRHPDNPRIFLFRTQPTLLITSGEHYGAVLNRAFRTSEYLKTLAAAAFNLTRIFSGVYCEPPDAFGISKNTLAPAPEDFLCPWSRSSEPGPDSVGRKFDLTQWDPAYFERLRQFLEEASQHGIVVEYVFFCPFYEEGMWSRSPLHPDNHVNGPAGLKGIRRNEVWSLDRHRGLLGLQEALIRKVCRELAGFDNLYYEVCNEPYVGKLPQDWHDHMARCLVEAEKDLPDRHLISWNVANDTATIRNPDPAYGLFNFHYANPPRAVVENASLPHPLGDNETGFRGQGNGNYRREAWEFLMAGGALFNHLDYSFAVGHEDGSYEYPATQPGGGNAKLRSQFTFLATFLNRLDLAAVRPAQHLILGGVPEGCRAWMLAVPGQQYALYLTSGPATTLTLQLEKGRYRMEWFKPTGGKRLESRVIDAKSGPHRISTPSPDPDLAMSMVRE